MNPKVSLILPVYNVEPYLARCLDALIGQTLAEIEIICVDDCSPDNSLAILKQYAEKDTRIKIVRHEKNQRLAAARNSGLLVATGEYVTFLDSDDYIAHDFVEKLYSLAKRENADIAKGAYRKIYNGVLGDLVSNNADVRKNKYNFRFALWTAIFRRSLLQKHGIKFIVDTIVFQIKAVYYANTVATTDDAVYYYVRRDDSNDSPVFSLEKWQDLNIRGAELVLDFINSVPMAREDYGLLVNNLILRLPLYGYERLAKNDVAEGTKILSEVMRRFQAKIQSKNKLEKEYKEKLEQQSESLQLRDIARRSTQKKKAEHFVVAEYPLAISTNIGDCIQQAAISGALSVLFPSMPIHTVARDAWCDYRGGGLSVMQGWFGYRESFPSGDTLPLWIGAHFTKEMRAFVTRAAAVNRTLFGRPGFGARDRKTLELMQTIDSGAYLSRCYTLTLPRRAAAPDNGRVFLVNIPDEWEAYIPVDLLDGAVRIKHGVRDISSGAERAAYARSLLQRYADEARLVITCKVHSASPCTAMGVPVVVITESSESAERMSFLLDLIKGHSQNDLRNGNVNWNPGVPDIEDLKALMMENLRLSVLASLGKIIDSDAMLRIRKQIGDYSLRVA